MNSSLPKEGTGPGDANRPRVAVDGGHDRAPACAGVGRHPLPGPAAAPLGRTVKGKRLTLPPRETPLLLRAAPAAGEGAGDLGGGITAIRGSTPGSASWSCWSGPQRWLLDDTLSGSVGPWRRETRPREVS